VTQLLPEAHTQAMIAALELSRDGRPANAASLAGVEYFRRYREDWSEALTDLVTRGLLAREGDAYALTERGRAQAERLHEARPPIYYWYRAYYEAIRESAAYAQFCERVFGRDFGQHGFSDMYQVKAMLARLCLGPQDRVLELGCGNGAMAEYIAEATGARVAGIDYIPEAIRQARERAERRPGRLTFYVGDIGHLADKESRLPFRPHSFDALIAVDTLYFTDLRDTLGQMRCLLAPGGQMGLFYGHDKWLSGSQGGLDRSTLAPRRTPLGEALAAQGLGFDVLDFSRANYQHALLKKAVLEELRPALEAEGNRFIYENRYAEAKGVIRAFEAGTAVRYLYLVKSGA
jgi:SAM-dependent methyltransferase